MQAYQPQIWEGWELISKKLITKSTGSNWIDTTLIFNNVKQNFHEKKLGEEKSASPSKSAGDQYMTNTNRGTYKKPT